MTYYVSGGTLNLTHSRLPNGYRSNLVVGLLDIGCALVIVLCRRKFCAVTLEWWAIALVWRQLTWRVVEPRDVHTLESQSCEFCLCDNRWHSVHAVMANGRLSLRVDAATVTDGLTSPSLDLHHELFIGGISRNWSVHKHYHELLAPNSLHQFCDLTVCANAY